MENIIGRVMDSATGKNARWFWIVAILVIIIILVLFPYIDANILAPNRLSQRIEFLEKLLQFDEAEIAKTPELNAEYKLILKDLEATREKSIGKFSTNQTSQKDYWVKFSVSAVIDYFFAILFLFKGKAKIIDRIIMFILLIGCGAAWGWLWAMIPTIINPWVHAVGAAILSFVVLALIFYNSENKQKK